MDADSIDLSLAANKDFLENLYQRFQQNPDDLPDDWKNLFSQTLSDSAQVQRPSWARELEIKSEDESLDKKSAAAASPPPLMQALVKPPRWTPCAPL